MKAATKIVILLVLAATIAGGCAGAPGGGMENPDVGPYGPENYERQIEAGSYTVHPISLKNDTRAKVTVASERGPVNVLVVDQRNLDLYRQELAGFNVSFSPGFRRMNVTGTSFVYTNVPGTYYLIVENAAEAPGSAVPGFVKANIAVEYLRPGASRATGVTGA
jgi:hypothetical protein